MSVLKRKLKLYKKLQRYADAGFHSKVIQLSEVQTKRDQAAAEVTRMDELHKSSLTLYSGLRDSHLNTDEARQLSNRYLGYLTVLVDEKRQCLQDNEKALSAHLEQLKHERALRQAMESKVNQNKRALYESYEKQESIELLASAAARESINDRG